MCPARRYGNANLHKRKHLLAFKLLHKGFDKKVDKVAGDGKQHFLCWNEVWENLKSQR